MASRRRRKLVLAGLPAGLLLIGGVAAFNAGAIREFYDAWRIGYRFHWMPENVAPNGAPLAHHLNDSGQVAVNCQGDDTRWRGARWYVRDKQLHMLPVLAGDSMAIAINEKGHVIGQLSEEGIETSASQRGFFWSPDEGVVEIPSAGDGWIVPADINNGDQVVGVYSDSLSVPRALLWAPNSAARDLGALVDKGESLAIAINDDGWIVGNAVAADGERHPVLWKPGSRITDLGLASGFTSGYCQSINSWGGVLVNLQRQGPRGEVERPFLWRESDGYRRLRVPVGYDVVRGADLTDEGVVLLWAEGERGFFDLDQFLLVDGNLTKLPVSPLGEANDCYWYCSVNKNGWVAGFVMPSPHREQSPLDGELFIPRGFVAVPVW